jgi:uncharacterized membrane protein YfcA
MWFSDLISFGEHINDEGRELGTSCSSEYAEIQQPLSDYMSGGGPMVGLLVSSALILTLGSLAAGAGVGGGALYVTIFNLLLVKYIKAAVPLSKSTILGAAIGNFVALARQSHPHADRPKIDYEISTFMQSGELLGVTFGVLLNMLLPDLLIKIFMCLLLTYNSYKTFNKGVKNYRKENINREKAAKAEAEEDKEGLEMTPQGGELVARATSSDLIGGSRSDSLEITHDLDLTEVDVDTKGGKVMVGASDDPESQEGADLAKLNAEAAERYPRWAYAIILTMTVYTIGYALLKQEVFHPCSKFYPAGYWLWYFTPVPVLLTCMYLTADILLKNHKRRVAAGYKYIKTDTYEDMQWSYERLSQFPISAVFAGIAAGLVGIGGGMVIGPLFMMINLEPTVGTASCAFMILWTASSGVLQYWVAGKIHWTFIVYFAAFGFLSGQIGQKGVDRVLKATGRPSYVIFLLAGIIMSACVTMTANGIVVAIKEHNDGNNLFTFSTEDFQCTKCS